MKDWLSSKVVSALLSHSKVGGSDMIWLSQPPSFRNEDLTWLGDEEVKMTKCDADHTLMDRNRASVVD